MTLSLDAAAVAPAGRTGDVDAQVREIARRAKTASRALATATRSTKDAALHAMADAVLAATDEILAANELDLAAGRAAGLSAGLLDRLTLTAPRLSGIADALREARRSARPGR